MVKKLFTIRDSKSEVFNAPFAQATHAEAERSFARAAADPKTTIHQYPEDFDLWYLGDFDENSGKLLPCDSPQHICNAVTMLPKPSNAAEQVVPKEVSQ
jgi:hypothetical protein